MSVPVSVILERKGHDVATIGPHASLGRVAQELTARRIGALVVAGPGGELLGIVSERDLVRELSRSGPAALERTVAEVMTRAVTTCLTDTGTEALMALMTDRRIRHLPVVDDEGSLVGIVSIGDVVKSRLDELASERRHLESYVTGSAY